MRTKVFICVFFLGLSLTSQSAVIDRGCATFYDPVLNITWLQYADWGSDSPLTGPFGDHGTFQYDNAVAWTDGLEYGVYDDWRLPSMDVNGDGIIVDCSSASESQCRDNELGYMFYYNLMGSPGDNLSGDIDVFRGIETSMWSSTEDVGLHPDGAWAFEFYEGSHRFAFKGNQLGAWAVRDGNVSFSPPPAGARSLNPVPLPAGVWLLASGLIGMGGLRRITVGTSL